MMKAWHFTNETLRDGRSIPAIGEKLVHTGPLKMCQTGFHASKHLIDALLYAPGSSIHRVVLSGIIVHDNDKSVASERTILWSISNADDVLHRFARRCALDVIHLWDAPAIVIEYLKTGDKSTRQAAWDAATSTRAAAWTDAAWDATATAATAAAAAAAATSARVAAAAAAWDAAAAASFDAAWATQNRRLTSMVIHAKRHT